MYSTQRTPGTLQSRHCCLGATQLETVKSLIVWAEKMAEISNSAHLLPSEAEISHWGKYSKLNLFLGRKVCNLFNYTHIHKDVKSGLPESILCNSRTVSDM